MYEQTEVVDTEIVDLETGERTPLRYTVGRLHLSAESCRGTTPPS